MPKSPRKPATRKDMAERVEVYRPGMKGRTDWARVRATTDEEIRRQIAADPDVAPELDDEWLAQGEVVLPKNKEGVFLRLDHDLLEFFREGGRGYQTRINAVLRQYMRAKKAPPARTPRSRRTKS